MTQNKIELNLKFLIIVLPLKDWHRFAATLPLAVTTHQFIPNLSDEKMGLSLMNRLNLCREYVLYF
jgi:hypothetical protein